MSCKPDLEWRKREISALVEDIASLTRGFREQGIDVSDPGDREAYDIICRIERKLLSAHPAKKSA